jgi:hypothetical protein
MNKTASIRSFKVFEDHIQVIATSGNEYTITENGCSCKGFGFRRNCGHFDDAMDQGLIDLLHKQAEQKQVVYSKSPRTIQMRKEAIKQFLTKRGLSYSDSLVDLIESKMTSKSKPEEIIEMAKRSS